MKALLTAFTLLSFVAASSLPMVASAEDMKGDQTMSKSDHDTKSTASTKHSKSHKSAHKTGHKKSAKKSHRKHMAKKGKGHDKDMTKMPPKAG
jgi:Ni/Co efflux regulator RcnB